MTMVTIERFEGEWALCEDDNGNPLRLSRGSLPADAREGDVLRQDSGGAVSIDRETAKILRRRNADRLRALAQKTP